MQLQSQRSVAMLATSNVATVKDTLAATMSLAGGLRKLPVCSIIESPAFQQVCSVAITPTQKVAAVYSKMPAPKAAA